MKWQTALLGALAGAAVVVAIVSLLERRAAVAQIDALAPKAFQADQYCLWAHITITHVRRDITNHDPMIVTNGLRTWHEITGVNGHVLMACVPEIVGIYASECRPDDVPCVHASASYALSFFYPNRYPFSESE